MRVERGLVGDDIRPSGLLRRLPSEPGRPRLAWRPWLRWTIINGPIWALLGAALALWWVRNEAERVWTPKPPVFPAEPVRKD